ncbi:MAG TPA: VOC family protein [Chloroflexota bacterium]|jgi:catechol 2,3-dioxygenase-like lactoylglutathione lyase family enzyme
MSLASLHHVQMAMPRGREEEARAFYGGLLGLRELPKPEHLRPRGGVWFATGSLELHLGVDPEFRAAKKAHVALQVADLAGLREHLQAERYPVVEDEPLAGYARFYTEDPFGNRLELLQPNGSQ